MRERKQIGQERGMIAWAKSRKGQQFFTIVGFMIIPLTLLLIFTYFPFAEMVKFSFYKMKYTTPVDRRIFVGWQNYLDVFRRKDCFGALKLSLYYMVGAILQLFLALFLATILSFKIKGGNLFKGLMFFPYLIILAVIIFALLRVSARDKARRIAMMSNPEYAKMVNARAREKAEREAQKRAQKEAKRANRKGLFGKKKTEPAAAPPQTEKEAAPAPETADRSNTDLTADNKGQDSGQSD